MTLLEIAAELHRIGDQVQESMPAPFPRDQMPDIQDAAEKITAVLPAKQTFSISFSYWPKLGASHRVDWTIWDGKKSHSAPSLAQAINDCLAAHTPQPEPKADTIEQVDRMLTVAAAPF